MSITTVKIANMALGRAGGLGNISSMTEESDEAFQCNLHYEHLRQYLLSRHSWQFATGYKSPAALSLVGDVPEDFDYAYLYPPDALRIQRIYTLAENPPVVFKMGYVESKKVILTDEENATIIYTINLDIPTQFDPAFRELLIAALALRIIYAVRPGDKQRIQDLKVEVPALLAEAMAQDGNQNYNDHDFADTIEVLTSR